jgi:predicted nucleotidyltransferase
MVTVNSHCPLAEMVQRMAEVPSVVAIALVGSRVSGMAEASSDFDLFVYTDGDVRALRSRLADELADPTAWRSLYETAHGDGDVWRLKESGRWVDLMYWSTAWGEAQLRRVLVEHGASMGYSTAFWRSIRDAHPLYERDAWHAELQRRARRPYPEELRRNIIGLNYPYLRDHPFSYRHQAAKALARHDGVSVNHRVATWLAGYFDIIFALNRVLHPGEKRLLEHVVRECPLLPAGMARAVERLVGPAGRAGSSLLDTMDALTADLEALLRRERLLPDGNSVH